MERKKISLPDAGTIVNAGGSFRVVVAEGAAAGKSEKHPNGTIVVDPENVAVQVVGGVSDSRLKVTAQGVAEVLDVMDDDVREHCLADGRRCLARCVLAACASTEHGKLTKLAGQIVCDRVGEGCCPDGVSKLIDDAVKHVYSRDQSN